MHQAHLIQKMLNHWRTYLEWELRRERYYMGPEKTTEQQIGEKAQEDKALQSLGVAKDIAATLGVDLGAYH